MYRQYRIGVEIQFLQNSSTDRFQCHSSLDGIILISDIDSETLLAIRIGGDPLYTVVGERIAH